MYRTFLFYEPLFGSPLSVPCLLKIEMPIIPAKFRIYFKIGFK
jgi:hypothetical protein